jgi:hypothetical protein
MRWKPGTASSSSEEMAGASAASLARALSHPQGITQSSPRGQTWARAFEFFFSKTPSSFLSQKNNVDSEHFYY